jgi:hypothetical protein
VISLFLFLKDFKMVAIRKFGEQSLALESVSME